MTLKQMIAVCLRPFGKYSFLKKQSAQVKILDLGCGNNSPYLVKQVLDKSYYVGVDVTDHNQIKPNLADEYHIFESNKFVDSIANLPNDFDVLISSHNLEHCDDREKTFKEMLKKIKSGGMIYLSFPCEESVNFPRRKGTLNYFDDETHKFAPPNFNEIVFLLKENNFELIFKSKRYRPEILFFMGLIFEPLSALLKKIFPGTWEFYGFESIIWARKLS